MKKIVVAASSTISYLYSATLAVAASTPENLNINKDGLPGYFVFSDFMNAALRLAFIVAIIGVLVMLIWGGVSWVISGGEKEAVGEARKRIVNALIGLAILAVAFAIANFAASFLGISDIFNFVIPTPTSPTPGVGTNTK